jgi:hypothetical protein
MDQNDSLSQLVALSRLLVSRAFTCHQMEALLSRALPAELGRSRARIVLVFGLAEIFADEDVPYAEACRVFRLCLSSLRRLSREGARIALAGDASAAPGREGFFRHLERTADPLLLLGGR